MRSISKNNCENIGTVIKSHGLLGEVVVQFPQHFLPSFEEINQLFIEIDGLLVPFSIEDDLVRFRTYNTANIKLKYIDNQDQAKSIVNSDIYAFKEDIIIEDNDFSIEDAIGYIVYSSKNQCIGPILYVNNYSGNIVLTVKYKDQEVLIPISQNLINSIDHNLKNIILEIPQGLLEIYN